MDTDPPKKLEPEFLPVWYGALRVLIPACGNRPDQSKMLPVVASVLSVENAKK